MNILKQSIEAVIKQGEQSIRVNVCQYKYGELKCAVGHLITDEHYNCSLEGYALNTDNAVHNALNESLGYEVSKQEISQLQNIQEAHDSAKVSSFLEDFKSGIRQRINEMRLPEELRELVS